jgi:soluble lytic murein transglycosylase-like protein
MNSPAFSRFRRIGILFHGNKLWISELVSLVFAGIVLCTLFSLSFLILFNESAIHRRDKHIAELKAELTAMDNTISQRIAQERVGAALKSVAGGVLSDRLYYQLVGLVYNNSKTFGYDPLLILAVIQVESVFKPDALGRYKNLKLSGALGLMQLMPETAREIAANLGISIKSDADIFRPDVNLAVGVAYLTKLISSFKSFKLGLLAYNQGPGVIKEQLQGNHPLSIDYYHRVLKKYYALKNAVDKR